MKTFRSKPVFIAKPSARVQAMAKKYGILGTDNIDIPEPGIDPSAQAVINAMGTTPDETRQELINNLVKSGKTHGWWAKGEWIHIYAAHAEDSSLLNWFNPGTFDGTKVLSPGFTIDNGFDGDYNGGSDEYINSNYNPSTDAISLTAANCGAVVGLMDNYTTHPVCAMGCNDSTNYFYIYPYGSTDVSAFRIFNGGGSGAVEFANTDCKGHFGVFRTGTDIDTYKNKSKESGVADGTSGLVDLDITVTARNNTGLLDLNYESTIGYAGMFQFLTTAQWEYFVDDMETFLDALGVGLIT